MALSKKALQRKREKKNKKRQMKRHPRLHKMSVNFSGWMLHECWISEEIWDCGIGHVLVTRKNFDGQLAVGVYLIDTFCLGIKNCFSRLANDLEYQAILNHIRETDGNLKSIDPIYANTLIYKSAAYAKQFNFKPHPDFAEAKSILKNIPIDEELKFTFGKDGQPLYIQGPNESVAEVKRIFKNLELFHKQE